VGRAGAASAWRAFFGAIGLPPPRRRVNPSLRRQTRPPFHSPHSIRFRTRINPSSPETLDRELAATTHLVVVRVLRRWRWRLAEGGAAAGSSSPWSVWTSSPEHPGSMLHLRQAPDLLPPHLRPLEQPPLLQRDVLLPLHRAGLVRLLPNPIERGFQHRFARFLPLPQVGGVHLRAGMCSDPFDPLSVL
jgi:hypothetical protein